MKKRIFNVAILGPESTGKSELAAALAGYYHTVWVPEYAREYFKNHTGEYTMEDVLKCLDGQRASEAQQLNVATDILFFDTEMINFKVWLEDKYGAAPAWITEDLKSRYDFYLLTYPDLPFVEDPLRENPDRREFLFDWYKREIEAAGIPYAVIKGSGAARTEAAVEAVEAVM